MKKIILAVVILLAATVGIGPKIVANSIDTQLNHVVTTLNANPNYQAELIEIKQSWFSTQAKISVKLDMAALPNAQDNPILQQWGELALVLNFNAEHGPVLTGEHSGLAWSNWSLSYAGDSIRDTLEWPKDIPFYHVQATTHLFGSTSYQDNFPAFTITDDESATHISFSGYQGQGVYSGDELTYQATADSADFQLDKVQAKVQQLSVNMSMQTDLIKALEGALYDSTAQITLEHIEVQDSHFEPKTFTLDGFDLTTLSKIDEQQQLANIEFSYALRAFDADGYQGKDLLLALQVNNISNQFVQQYQQQMQGINAQDPDQVLQHIQQFMQKNLLAQLKLEPQMKITQLSGTLPEGQFNGNSSVSFKGIEALPADLSDSLFWLQHLHCTSNLSVDKGIAEMVATQTLKTQLANNPQMAELDEQQKQQIIQQQIPVMLTNLVQQGMLKETEQGYSADITINNGTAKINSVEIPLAPPAQ